MAALLVATVVTVKLTADHYADRVQRLPDPFVSLEPSTRPSPTPNGKTFLVLGLDAESNDAQARADAIMVVHINESRDRAYVVSIPRDSWVEVPGHGTKKINASYALGGPALAVQTVEKVTKLRIDHVAVTGWDGFRAMTDAVGGVEVTIPQNSYHHQHGGGFPQGTHRLDGERALQYVRQRYGLPRGDLDRMHRQQHFLRALMTQMLDQQTLTDPGKLNALLQAVTGAVKVDSRLTNDHLWSLATDLPKLRGGVRFLNAPIKDQNLITDEHGNAQSIFYLDPILGEALWQAVSKDQVDEYLAKHGGDVLGDTPR